jgi:short-subunit dehydrogenase
MPKSIAVFGVGPALGQAVARRYAREGWTVVLVARRRQPLEALALELTEAGAIAHAISADLSNSEAVPLLAEKIRAHVGELDAFYYGAAVGGFVSAVGLLAPNAMAAMPVSLITPIALVQEFLPHMLEQADGAILTAQGASAMQGRPNMTGPGPALAAQRNYLQSLEAEVAGLGVYVGRLYIGAAIEHSAFYLQREAARAAGNDVPEIPTVDPAHLADVLWNMHRTKSPPEAKYPNALIDR